MPDPREPQSVIAEAEQAAAGGDFASAERLLREAARLQEATLGPQHPDLANTLNNLGVVCEMTNKPDEAEACFRRAHEIAAAVLEPDHPFVATSRQNLEDFLATRAKPAALPTPPGSLPAPPAALPTPAATLPAPHAALPAPPAALPPPAASPLPPPPTAPAVDVEAGPSRGIVDDVVPPRSTLKEAPPVVSRTSARAIAIGLVLVAAVLAAFLADRLWFREDGASEPSPASVSSTPTSPAERPAAANQTPADPATSSVPKETASINGKPATKDSTKATGIAKSATVVAEVRLCRDMQAGGPASGQWKCNPPARPVPAGRLLFYTRLKSPTDAMVQHRWYRDDRLQKSVDLTIRANPGSGYRTFSRNTVAAGEWRVELRTPDGVVLHSEQFTVR